MKLRLLFIVILLCIAGGASADDADRLIADFDRKADVASANKFFEFLDRREFTDSKIVFPSALGSARRLSASANVVLGGGVVL